MSNYEVDDELAAVIERLAKKKPFENLSFQDALWRVVREYVEKDTTIETPDPLEDLMTSVRSQMAHGSKKPSPSVTHWVASVPELAKHRHLTSWKAVCEHLKIPTGFDSARRKLAAWVRTNKPDWSTVPEVE